MYAEAFFFWIFSIALIGSALAVILARNPVHSVLFLILAFVCAAGLFLLMGAEFLGMMLIVVYVGAVAVLFLFVVMMLDINFAELRKGINSYLPFGIFLGVILFIELVFLVFQGWVAPPPGGPALAAPAPMLSEISNTRALGQLIYTHYLYIFQVSGLILLVAMIGAIVLTLRHRPGVQRQRIAEQIGRKRGDVMTVKEVSFGAGAPVE